MAAVEWVPAVAGGVVGLAGIVASSLAARGERTLRRRLVEREQQDRDAAELRASRRQIYSRYLSSVHGNNEPELMTAFQEVCLVAGPAVQRAVAPSYLMMARAFAAIEEEGSSQLTAGEIAHATATLTMAMRQELGTPEEDDGGVYARLLSVWDNPPGMSAT